MLGGEIGKITWEEQSKRNSLVCNILVNCEGVEIKVTGIKYMIVFIRRSDSACFSYGYNDSAALCFWERDILYPFPAYIIRHLLCLIERGSEDSTVWVRGLLRTQPIRVRKFKGGVTINKSVFVDKISNSAGHK